MALALGQAYSVLASVQDNRDDPAGAANSRRAWICCVRRPRRRVPGLRYA